MSHGWYTCHICGVHYHEAEEGAGKHDTGACRPTKSNQKRGVGGGDMREIPKRPDLDKPVSFDRILDHEHAVAVAMWDALCKLTDDPTDFGEAYEIACKTVKQVKDSGWTP